MTPPIEWLWEITRENVSQKLQWITEEERKIILEELQKDDKESKEDLENIPELEDKNFTVKDTSDRIKIKEDRNGFKVRENPEGDAREYINGKYKWQQIFIPESALRETKKVGKKLPASWKVYENILYKKYQWNYKKFLKWEKMKFCGKYNPTFDIFDLIDEGFDMQCADGSIFMGFRKHWFYDIWNVAFGHSVRCEKD